MKKYYLIERKYPDEKDWYNYTSEISSKKYAIKLLKRYRKEETPYIKFRLKRVIHQEEILDI